MTTATTDVARTALHELRRLRQSGTLEQEFPGISALLAQLGPHELTTAGRLLGTMSTARLRDAHPAVDIVHLQLTGSGTLATLGDELRAQFARHSTLAVTGVGDFAGWRHDMRDLHGPVFAADTVLTLVVLDASEVIDRLPVPWQVPDAATALTDLLRDIRDAATHYAAHGRGTLVVNTVPLHPHAPRLLVDRRSRRALGVAWREFNAELLRLPDEIERLEVLDLEALLATTGPLQDPRLATYAKAHLADDLLAGYAREVAHLYRGLRGGTKKVLVLDLDNTLWDGILGDDGPGGIAAAVTYRGEAFGNLQRAARQLGSQGVLLAACSKNDADAVSAVLREHPDMTLRPEDFVDVTANWEPKPENLANLARRLNLGIDSMVFVDDSPFECTSVAETHPSVAVIQLSEEPAEHVERLLADGWFDVRAITAADRERPTAYRAEAERQAALATPGASAAEQLRRLQLCVHASPVTDVEVERVAQLTLRTNQFNLTTLRLTPADVQRRRGDRATDVIAIRTTDRFGDSGVVGAVFAHTAGTELVVDNLILSCRVFNRGIEQAVVAGVLRRAAAAGRTAVRATYRPTRKNMNVAGFWPSLGFVRDGGTDIEPDFRHDLTELPPVPGHLTLSLDLDLDLDDATQTQPGHKAGIRPWTSAAEPRVQSTGAKET